MFWSTIVFGREAFRSTIEDRLSVLPLYCLPCVLPLSLLSRFRGCKGNVARLFDSAAADSGAIGTMLPKSCPGRSCMTTLSGTEQLYIVMNKRELQLYFYLASSSPQQEAVGNYAVRYSRGNTRMYGRRVNVGTLVYLQCIAQILGLRRGIVPERL